MQLLKITKVLKVMKRCTWMFILSSRKRKKNMSNEKKKKKSKKVLRFFVRIFDVYFLLKSHMKFIEIDTKKEFIKIFIFLNTKENFLTYKIS